MVWVTNPIEKESLDTYYKEMSKYEAAKYVGKSDSSKLKMFLRQKKFVDEYVKDYDSILEIGAATGENLSLYKDDGKKVLGIEPSGNNKRYAAEEYGIEMFDMTFEEYYEAVGEQEKYDLVFFSHVLEHIVEFEEFIKRAVALSNKYMFVEVPFIESMGERMEPYGLFTDEHVNYFSISSLEFLFHKNNCSLVKYKIERNEGGESPGYPTLVSLWIKNESEMLENRNIIYTAGDIIEKYMNNSAIEFKKIETIIDTISSDERLAIWGTGAHTSRLLAMTNLASKNIIKFYDSDIKKKDKTMLGKKIQPFDVADVQDGTIDTILISTYSSEKTIANYIDNLNVAKKFKVIKLYS